MKTFCADTAGIWRVIGYVVYIIRIAIPIIIVLLGTLDLGKAVIAGEDKKIKEAQKSFIMRLIYGIAIFFVFTIVKVIFGILGVNTDSGDPKICWDCATKPNNKACTRYTDKDDTNTYNNYDGDDDYYYDADSGNLRHSKEDA